MLEESTESKVQATDEPIGFNQDSKLDAEILLVLLCFTELTNLGEFKILGEVRWAEL